MRRIEFFLVAFVSFSLVTTEMATGQSGSDDVRLTSSSSTSSAAAAAAAGGTTDCFTANSRAIVCSFRGADDTRHDDVVATSRPEYNVTTTSTTRPLSHNDDTTSSHPVDSDVTSGASCGTETPRKSEREWRFRWNFTQSHSYLNLTLNDEDSMVVSAGYFVVVSSGCDGLVWNATFVGRNRKRTFQSIVSRRGSSSSSVNGSSKFSFSLNRSLEAREVYFTFAGRQREATEDDQMDERGTQRDERGTQRDERGTQQNERGTQQDERGAQPDYCGFMVDLELLHPCDGATESNILRSTTTKTPPSASRDGTLEAGTPKQSSSSTTPDRSFNPSNAPADIQSRRTTPFPLVETTLVGSTEPSTQKSQSYRCSFRIRNQDFLPKLSQNTTEEFLSLYRRIHPLLNACYSSTCGAFYRGIQRISFRSGSIIVDNWFEMTRIFDELSRNKSSAFIIDEFGRNGFDVDPNSFDFESDNGGNAKDDQPDVENLLLIVVVSTVLGVLVIVLIVTASLLIWRKTRRHQPADEDETERQRAAAQEERTSDVISGVPRSHLMWQNMPSLKASFDDQSLFVYELPTPSPPKTYPSPTHKLPRASSSSFSNSSASSSSSTPKNFLSYSHSHPSADPKRNPGFYIPRPRTTAESTHHASFSGISPRGWGNSQHGAETSQVWGQLPLDYNSVTHDYFVSGPSTISSAEPAKKRNPVRSQSTRPWSRTTKFLARKGSSAPDAVDFGNVFLPSAPPFQFADVLRCHDLSPEDVERSGKTTRRSTSVEERPVVNSDEHAVDGVNNNTSSGKSEQENGLEGRGSTDRCCCQSAEHVTSPTQSPHTSGSITNSQVNLLSVILSKSPKKKRNSQMPDNIHRSTIFSLADDAFFQVDYAVGIS